MFVPAPSKYELIFKETDEGEKLPLYCVEVPGNSQFQTICINSFFDWLRDKGYEVKIKKKGEE